MRTIGISHKTRYWQHYCFSNPPEGHRYARMPDIPWHVAGIKWDFLANTKFFLPYPRPDLYHTYNGVVANAHPWVVEVESYLPRYQRMPRTHPLYRWALRRLAGKHCKAIIFTSHRTMGRNRPFLEAAGVDPAKMTVVYRAVEQFGHLGGDPSRFTILFAGNGFYRKGGVELLKAFRRMDRTDARLVIISRLETDWGLCPLPEVKAWAEKTIAEDPRITLHRQLPHDRVIEHMRAADLFVGATYLDPFNNTVLEAMGAGLPVICSDAGALGEVVEHGRNGWVMHVNDKASDDVVDELSALLVRMMDDPEGRRRMGRESHAIVQEKFSLDTRNGRLLKLYAQALADH